ncbi:MAG: hypothetical protein WB763_03750 [Terriglobia bacterium]|jgi:hypothetical protein
MVNAIQQAQINADKQMAKEIVIAYISHANLEHLFEVSMTEKGGPVFETLWRRVFKMVSANN